MGRDEGMEMVEWAIVGVIFAIAVALFWSPLVEALSDALDLIHAFFRKG
jgi:hypothetical protein